MTPEQLKRLANQIAQQTYDYIISCTRIDRPTALAAAVAAGNKAAQCLEQDLYIAPDAPGPKGGTQ